MNWTNLVAYACPVCGESLTKDSKFDIHECKDPDCEFRISDTRLKEIAVNKIRKQKQNRYVEPDRSGWQ